MRLTLVEDTTVYTEGNYDSAMETLFEGALLGVIVVLLFLRDWRATIITALALPLSIIPTFFVISYLGFSLNTISLLGITLVTGILVDDAIVEIENIVRHIKMGKGAYEASEEAASEIGLTVIAISFTIVAVFAPVSFMAGIAGQYFKQFGLTVAIAVLFSLLVARLITPMMAAYFLRGETVVHEERDGFVMRAYMRVLRWTLRNRTVTLHPRSRHLRGLHLLSHAAAHILHPANGRGTHRRVARTAAGFDARRHGPRGQGRLIPHRGPSAGGAGDLRGWRVR